MSGFIKIHLKYKNVPWNVLDILNIRIESKGHNIFLQFNSSCSKLLRAFHNHIFFGSDFFWFFHNHQSTFKQNYPTGQWLTSYPSNVIYCLTCSKPSLVLKSLMTKIDQISVSMHFAT